MLIESWWLRHQSSAGPVAVGGNPVLHRSGHEFRSIVGSDVAEHATQDDEVIQDFNSVDGLDFVIDDGRQLLSPTA